MRLRCLPTCLFTSLQHSRCEVCLHEATQNGPSTTTAFFPTRSVGGHAEHPRRTFIRIASVLAGACVAGSLATLSGCAPFDPLPRLRRVVTSSDVFYLSRVHSPSVWRRFYQGSGANGYAATNITHLQKDTSPAFFRELAQSQAFRTNSSPYSGNGYYLVSTIIMRDATSHIHQYVYLPETGDIGFQRCSVTQTTHSGLSGCPFSRTAAMPSSS